MSRIAINGFGRIGRLLLRQALSHPELEVVAVNDLGDIENLAYLFKYDTVYGRFPGEVSVDKAAGTLTVDGKVIRVLQVKEPKELPWGEMGVDLAVEATGLCESFGEAKAHLQAGAKRVILPAPAKDEDGEGRTVLMGVNQEVLADTVLSSNASCTTNSASPVIQVLSENPGILKAVLGTVHAFTTPQNLADGQTRGRKPQGDRGRDQFHPLRGGHESPLERDTRGHPGPDRLLRHRRPALRRDRGPVPDQSGGRGPGQGHLLV